ncbi:uncharacterized protein LOC110448557 isoform X2 [Mizuhopecten yessoensis]|uniref:uncharacterized protein LOC110448557 isoform X2 n=1 Tax=Mizuhopecten yessoensis TaxID=6573 RepID=UPI000B45B9B9|nr:uncharacterized protein LOC110448557 isoform X2 [Mizuhopecten yessoensis]
MATARTIDLAQATYTEKGIPEHTSNYTVRGFHNRNSSLFPTTQHNRLFTHRAEINHQDQEIRSLVGDCLYAGKPPASVSKSKILNRVQSATGRLEKNAQHLRNRADVNGVQSTERNKVNRPYSAVIDRSVKHNGAPVHGSVNHTALPCSVNHTAVHGSVNHTAVHGSVNHTAFNGSVNHSDNERTTPRCTSSSLHKNKVKKRIPSAKRTSSASSRYSSQQYKYSTDTSTSNIHKGLGKLEINNNEGTTYDPYEMALVPINGRQMPVVDIGGDAPVPEYDYKQPVSSKHVANAPKLKPFHTPCTNKTAEKSVLNDVFSDANVTKDVGSDEKDKEKEDRLKPSVFGLEKKRHIFGSTGDVSDAQSATVSFPYKLSTETPGMLEITAGTENGKRSLPEDLEPLRPWLTEDIMEDFMGVDPKKCLVFLPSLIGQDLSDIPEVPPPQSIETELSYKEKIFPPEAPKKYEHPSFNKKPLVEDWVCEHSKTHSRIYGADGSILHERFQGQRTSGVVRKELKELEELMKGIGTMDTDCSIVKYQAEIEKYRITHAQTMALIPERLLITPRPADIFGIREFCQEHDVIIQQIKEQHKLCLEELATLEVDAGIESERKYFKHQVHLPRSDESVVSDDS